MSATPATQKIFQFFSNLWIVSPFFNRGKLPLPSLKQLWAALNSVKIRPSTELLIKYMYMHWKQWFVVVSTLNEKKHLQQSIAYLPFHISVFLIIPLAMSLSIVMNFALKSCYIHRWHWKAGRKSLLHPFVWSWQDTQYMCAALWVLWCWLSLQILSSSIWLIKLSFLNFVSLYHSI